MTIWDSLRENHYPVIATSAQELQDLNDQIRRAAAAGSATAFLNRIAAQVADFESGLDASSEVAAVLASFGQAITIHVTAFVAMEPSLIVVQGRTPQGEPVRLVQHLTQISFLLVSATKLDPESPRRQIGFHTGADAT